MQKQIFIFFIIALISLKTNAQEKIVIENNDNYKFQSKKTEPAQTTTIYKSAPVFQPRWSYGGNIGMSFWNGGTDILLAPKAYYHISPKFLTGIGVTYIYSDGEYWNNNFNYHSNSFGGSVSALYRPLPFLQLSAEYEGLQTEWRGASTNDDSYWNNAIYLGASFVTGHFSFGFRYDVLYDNKNSVYGDAWQPFIGFYF